jgi:GDP-4-dehydro-6-deoxy-D-mannose reductase
VRRLITGITNLLQWVDFRRRRRKAMRRILITGITGFAGGHLAEALLARGDVELHGLSRRGQWPVEWRSLADKVSLRAADLSDRTAVVQVLDEVRPEQIYHLAGYPHVGQSVQQPEAAWSGNLTATRSLYEAMVALGDKPRLLYVGSGLIYGDPEMPEQAYHEGCLLRPTTPYSASKAAADLVSYQFTRSPGLDIVRARPFNHIGPCQSPQFAVAHFAEQVAAIEAGRQPPVLETGNLSPRRDLTDVRDTVQAYILLMDRGRSGEAYNVGTGQTLSMQEVLDRLLALAGVQVTVRQRSGLIRRTETPAVRADATKLHRETGWAPRFNLDRTLTDMLAYWRQNEGASL